MAVGVEGGGEDAVVVDCWERLVGALTVGRLEAVVTPEAVSIDEFEDTVVDVLLFTMKRSPLVMPAPLP